MRGLLNLKLKKMEMKTTMRFLSIMILSMFVTSAFAQPGPQQGRGQGGPRRTTEEMAKAQVERMKNDLNIDQATQNKIYDVALKYGKQSSETREKLMKAGDREAMRAKMAEISAARDKEFKAILGDKKFELFKTKEEERRHLMMQQRPQKK